MNRLLIPSAVLAICALTGCIEKAAPEKHVFQHVCIEEMPSVKGIQEKMGKDKFQVLLLSVDHDNDFGEKDPVKEDQDRLDSQAVDWPNVMLPNGWDDTQRLFNLDGYGPTLINPDGVVLGVNIQPEEVERLIAKDTHGPR